MRNSLLTQTRQFADEIRSWRRALHARPELSGREGNTARFIAKQLRRIGLTPAEHVGNAYGLTADLHVNDQPAIALRADFDALPIQEETGADYASTAPGVMHACGHDAHTAMLLGAARLLQQHKARLRRSVRLIFQPHEELFPGGALAMIAGGALEGVAAIFGIHVCTNLQIGEVGTRPGAFMAAVNPFQMVVTGKGGHAAMPDQCVDPVVAAAQIVVALQTIVSRSIPITEPAVVSVTQLQAGTADNVIPNQATLCGTIRTFDEAVRTHVCDQVREMAMGVAKAHRATADVHISPGYPVLMNDADLTQRALDAARSVGIDERRLLTLAPQGGGEDFAYYCQRVPGSFVFLGAANEAKDCVYPHHHPRFSIDEDVLPWGAALHAQFALANPAG
ncbi:MAG: M20 family metallopeptidase [Phycisphaerae bacterium]